MKRYLVMPAVASLALLGLAGPAQAADTTTTVTPNNPAGFSSAPDTGNGGTATLAADPAEPGSFGPGYLSMTTQDDNNSSKSTFFSYAGGARPLSDLTAASYQVYRDSASTGAAGNRPSLQLPVYRNIGVPEGSGKDYASLVFEPLYCYNDLTDDTWQKVDGDHQSDGGLGCWHYTKNPNTYYKTLAEAEAAFPNATLLGKGFDIGSYQPGIIARVDDLELTFNDGKQTYDFEAADRTPPPPPLSATIGDSTVAEGNAGTTAASFTVTLNRASTTDTVVHYTTSDGSASVADGDYSSATGDLTIPAGSTTGTITVQVNGDTKVESDEVYHVTITSNDASVSQGDYASGTITNDDSTPPPPPAKPSITIGDASTKEGNSGTHPLNFTVSLNHTYTSNVTVKYATASGTAKGGSDYVSKSGTLTIPAGSTTGTIPITINGGKTKEKDEKFTVKLSAPTNATIADSSAVGTIVNDD